MFSPVFSSQTRCAQPTGMATMSTATTRRRAPVVAGGAAQRRAAGGRHRPQHDSLLGKDGFISIKTGSDDAAGGCFMFRMHRAGGYLTGVVLGRRGHDVIAGMNAARDLAASLA
jgi:D-alanyl-D-alanine carboxypeptidase